MLVGYNITRYRRAVNSTVLISAAAAGFAVAFLHAALPTHWLPFVLVGRGQGWSGGKTLGVAALAGVGHALVTALLGALVVIAGQTVMSHLGDLFGWIVGGVLIATGLFYIGRHTLSGGHRHARAAGERRYGSDLAAITGLLALLALSPCNEFLPVYLMGSPHGWVGFITLSLVLMIATCAGMLLFTGLSLAGANRLKLETLERYEGAILGGALCLLGLVALFLGH